MVIVPIVCFFVLQFPIEGVAKSAITKIQVNTTVSTKTKNTYPTTRPTVQTTKSFSTTKTTTTTRTPKKPSPKPFQPAPKLKAKDVSLSVLVFSKVSDHHNQ